jgi:hypothetical protein
MRSTCRFSRANARRASGKVTYAPSCFSGQCRCVSATNQKNGTLEKTEALHYKVSPAFHQEWTTAPAIEERPDRWVFFGRSGSGPTPSLVWRGGKVGAEDWPKGKAVPHCDISCLNTRPSDKQNAASTAIEGQFLNTSEDHAPNKLDQI